MMYIILPLVLMGFFVAVFHDIVNTPSDDDFK